MPSSWSHTPNRGLQIASGLAQGLQSGFNAFQNARARNQELELQRLKIQGDAELRRLQMEKLRQEMAPVEFSMQKFQTIANAFEAGLVPEKMKNEAAQGIIDQADTPQKLQFLNTVIDRKKQADLQKISPSAMAEQFGSGAQVMEVPEAPEAPTPVTPAQEAPASLMLTPKEAEFYQGLVKSKYGTQAQFAGIQQRDQASERQLVGMLEGLRQKRDQIQTEDDRKRWEKETEAELKKYIAEFMGQNRVDVQALKNRGSLNTQFARNRGTFDAVDMRNKGAMAVEEERTKRALGVADLNAKSREKVAKTRGASGSRTAANPEQKMMLDLIKQGEKALSDANKPSSGLNMELPQEKVQRIQNANAHLQRLYNQYREKYGVDLRGGGSVPSQNAAPAKAPAKSPSASIKALTGDPATVKAQAKAMPDGQPYSFGGKNWVNQNGAPVPYVPQGSK